VNAEKSVDNPVENTDENAERCMCPVCPSYTTCMRSASELLYCGRQKSSCFVGTIKCICGSCPVWSAYGLTGQYYCMTGAV